MQQTLAIDRISARTVVAAVVAYVVLLMVLRLSLSPYLEIDEAQFFGQVDFRLVYANSHPPLYNWVLRLVLEATGWSWALSVALVKGVLLAAIHLLVFDTARRIGGVPAGVGALAVAALCPQISWMAA
ncbi:MAG: glycosyltransferase family 39 protein, partial [Pseudomonadota bacterium]